MKPNNTLTRKGRPKSRTGDDVKQDKYLVAFKKAKVNRGSKSRLCGNLNNLGVRLEKVITRIKHPKLCVVCDLNAYSRCGIYDEAIHFMPAKGPCIGKKCFFDYHNDAFFGLTKNDSNAM